MAAGTRQSARVVTMRCVIMCDMIVCESIVWVSSNWTAKSMKSASLSRDIISLRRRIKSFFTYCSIDLRHRRPVILNNSIRIEISYSCIMKSDVPTKITFQNSLQCYENCSKIRCDSKGMMVQRIFRFLWRPKHLFELDTKERHDFRYLEQAWSVPKLQSSF
jgi:hypothetical protein